MTTMAGKWVHYTAGDGTPRAGDVLERGLDAQTHEEVCYIVRWRLGSTEAVPAERVTYCELPPRPAISQPCRNDRHGRYHRHCWHVFAAQHTAACCRCDATAPCPQAIQQAQAIHTREAASGRD